MNRIGKRIKIKREILDLHLKELAEMVGISSSALSQIENAKSFPSLLTLKTIAEKLHTTVGELIGENESLGNKPVVLNNEIKFVDQNKSGTILFLLSNHDINKQMDTYLLRFTGASGIDGLVITTHGQIFCHVLSGAIRFDLDGISHPLKKGDNIYFNARLAYNAINSNEGISELLWIQSPPNF